MGKGWAPRQHGCAGAVSLPLRWLVAPGTGANCPRALACARACLDEAPCACDALCSSPACMWQSSRNSSAGVLLGLREQLWAMLPTCCAREAPQQRVRRPHRRDRASLDRGYAVDGGTYSTLRACMCCSRWCRRARRPQWSCLLLL